MLLGLFPCRRYTAGETIVGENSYSQLPGEDNQLLAKIWENLFEITFLGQEFTYTDVEARQNVSEGSVTLKRLVVVINSLSTWSCAKS